MKIKEMITTALLLAMGLTLHTVVPGIFGMKFDLLLTFMFLALYLNPTVKNTVLTGALGGLLTAMTTTFPGGQVPNIVDKLATAFIVFAVLKVFGRQVQKLPVMGAVGFIGTLSSGVIFLVTASAMAGLPAPFKALVIGVVLPTAVANAVITAVVFKTLTTVLPFKSAH